MNKRFAIGVILIISAAAAAFAQEARIDPEYNRCPRPFSTVIVGENSPPAPNAAAFSAIGINPTTVSGSQWNQTQVNKAFGTTFHFPAPGKDCCLMTYGVLIVKLKALQGGGTGSSSSWNDDIVVFSGTHKDGNQRIWSQTAPVHTGDMTQLQFPLSAQTLQSGVVSLYVEDDTAVVSAHLELRGCCIK